MSLSHSSLIKIADALAPEVAEYIFNSDEWIEFLIEQISNAVVENLGELDPDLHGNLCYAISERLVLKTTN